MGTVISVLFAIVLFSLLIFLHELGHFTVAKLSGVQVNEFSVFMGPAIFKKQVGETLYAIRCIPIGGYCAMEGEDESSDNPRAFGNAKWWKRLAILAAGSFMNLVTGFLLLSLTLMPAKRFLMPVIINPEPGCTVVSEDGLHEGDRILKVDGERIYVQSDFSLILSLNGGTVHDLVVERDGKKVALNDFEMQTHPFLNEDGTTTERYGFSFDSVEANFGNRIAYVWNSGIDAIREVRLSLQMLITGKAGVQDLSGPVGIVKIMSDTAAQSETRQIAFMNMIYFGAFIAINLAVMNMLPLPALDGGRIVCLLITAAYEGITKKKLNGKYEAYLHGAGMVLLLILMGVIMFKDIFFIFKG